MLLIYVVICMRFFNDVLKVFLSEWGMNFFWNSNKTNPFNERFLSLNMWEIELVSKIFHVGSMFGLISQYFSSINLLQCLDIYIFESYCSVILLSDKQVINRNSLSYISYWYEYSISLSFQMKFSIDNSDLDRWWLFFLLTVMKSLWVIIGERNWKP